VKLAAPLIIAAHVAHLPTLTGWSGVDVYEGQVTSRDAATRYVTVGYVAGIDGPTVHVAPVTDGQRKNRETGSVGCALVVADTDIAAARAAVFGLLEPWAEWVATDRSLAGVLLADSVVELVADVALITTRAGATATATVTLTYTAHTYG